MNCTLPFGATLVAEGEMTTLAAELGADRCRCRCSQCRHLCSLLHHKKFLKIDKINKIDQIDQIEKTSARNDAPAGRREGLRILAWSGPPQKRLGGATVSGRTLSLIERSLFSPLRKTSAR